VKLKKSPVYRRYLKYYSVMLILPAAVLCLVIGLLVNQLYVRTVFDTHRETARRIGRTLDSGLGGIEVLSARLSSATWLSPETLERSPLNVMEAIRKLKEIQGGNPFLADIVYRVPKSGLVLSSTSGANEKWSAPIIESAREFSITYRVPLRAKSPYGELSFVLSKPYLSEYVATEIAPSQEALEVWNGDSLLYAAGNAAERDSYAVSYDSRVNGWRFRFLTPRAPVEAGQRTVYLYLAGGVLLLFALGYLLIVRFARLTYSPVEKIDSYVRALYPPDAPAESDEFDWMYQALSRLHESGTVLRARNVLMEDAYRAMRLLGLIRGELQSEADLDKLKEDMGGEGAKRLVALVRQQEGEGPVKGLPEGLVKGGLDVRLIPLPEPGMTALFIAERAEGQAQRLLTSAAGTFRLRVGIGSSYEALMDASRSYMEAEAALYYATDARPAVPYRELEMRRASYRYPRKEVERIAAALGARDEKEIRDAAGALLKSLQQQILPVSIVRCICYDVVSTVIKLSIALTNQQSFPTAVEVSNIQSVEGLTDLMTRCVDDYVNLISRDKRKNDYIFAQILEYVDAHVYSADFSIGGMASALGFSQSYLSHLYKGKAGGNLIQLVSEKRIGRAKTLLRDTEMPLKDIIEQIGYTDPSNFIRKFKQETGMTPGEYKAKGEKDETA
jgi:AraC-like DNA-binding protein